MNEQDLQDLPTVRQYEMEHPTVLNYRLSGVEGSLLGLKSRLEELEQRIEELETQLEDI